MEIKLYKSINFFEIVDLKPDRNCSFSNISFNGNRDNKKGFDSWL